MTEKKKPKYRKVEEYLISQIAENDYPPDTLLPSEPALCRHFGVSRNTVRQALSNLIQEGIIYNEHGRGTFVAARRDGGNGGRSTRKKGIGIVLNSISQTNLPFFNAYLQGIHEELDLNENSVHLIFNDGDCDSKSDTSREEEVLGLIIIGHEANDDYILSLQTKRIPFVWFPSFRTNKKVSQIYLDKEWGLYLAVEHLVRLGHRKIAYIAGDPEESGDYQEKMHGFFQALEQFQVPMHKAWIADGYYTAQGGEAALAQILSSSKDSPTAFVTANDVMGLSVLRKLAQENKRVPEEFSVVGFDDIPEASSSNPPLTTVHVPMVKMGHEAARILSNMVHRKNITMINKVIVEPRLTVRKSTAPPFIVGNGS